MAYILIAFGGSYEDAWRSNIVVSRDLHKIELLKGEKELHRDTILEIKRTVEEYSEWWRKANPFDDSSMEKTVNLPKWPSGIDQRLITKEMRIERDTIKKFNDGVNQRNAARNMEYRTRNYNAEKDFARTLGLFELVSEESTQTYLSIPYSLISYSDLNYEIGEVKEI